MYRDYSCVLSAQQGLIFLAIEWIVYFFIAIYLDNLLPNESGVRRRCVQMIALEL